jgi:hypothetical protein
VHRLNPIWKEAFAKPCSVEEAGDCQLKISVGDWDAVTSRDFMGSCVIDLKGCVEAPNQPACRKWCLLDFQDDKKTQNVSGEVEIWYQWRYNPLLDFEPFTDVESDKAPNVLRVGLSQGRGLVVICVEINQCVGCIFLGDGAAILARSSGGEPASPRHRRAAYERAVIFDFHAGGDGQEPVEQGRLIGSEMRHFVGRRRRRGPGVG